MGILIDSYDGTSEVSVFDLMNEKLSINCIVFQSI